MEKTEITLAFDSERMRALTIYLKMENTTVQEKMDEAMRQLYEKAVPEPVREYLDIVSAPTSRPKRPSRSMTPKSKQDKPQTSDVPAAQRKEDAE